MKGMPWFRMYSEMIEDPKIGTLSDQDFRTWVELLCLACENGSDGDTGMDETELEWKLRRNVSSALQKLFSIGIVTFRETPKCRKNDSICKKTVSITNWGKRQFDSDSSTARVRKFRENKDKKTGNVSETPLKQNCHVIDTDTDTDTDKRKYMSNDMYSSPKVSDDECESEKSKAQIDNCPHQEIIDAYHEVCPELNRVKLWNETNKKNLRSRWRECEERQSVEWWRNFITEEVATSDFLMGRVNEFQASLGWIVGPKNFGKIVNGQYRNRKCAVRNRATQRMEHNMAAAAEAKIILFGRDSDDEG